LADVGIFAFQKNVDIDFTRNMYVFTLRQMQYKYQHQNYDVMFCIMYVMKALRSRGNRSGIFCSRGSWDDQAASETSSATDKGLIIRRRQVLNDAPIF
jgi:hypothetical protein